VESLVHASGQSSPRLSSIQLSLLRRRVGLVRASQAERIGSPGPKLALTGPLRQPNQLHSVIRRLTRPRRSTSQRSPRRRKFPNTGRFGKWRSARRCQRVPPTISTQRLGRRRLFSGRVVLLLEKVIKYIRGLVTFRRTSRSFKTMQIVISVV